MNKIIVVTWDKDGNIAKTEFGQQPECFSNFEEIKLPSWNFLEISLENNLATFEKTKLVVDKNPRLG